MSITVHLIQYMDCRYNILHNMLYYWLLCIQEFQTVLSPILNLLFSGIINMLHDIASPLLD